MTSREYSNRNSLALMLCASTWLASGAAAWAETAGPVAGQVAEIVVTAQRREESLQKVPMAITAITPETAERQNIRTVEQLQLMTPNLTIGTGFSFSQAFIRGVGTNFANPGLENAVATYLDGVYTPSSYGSVFDLVDPGVIQVLKGPQGTLYGRNASGGAILVSTADPGAKAGGHVTAEYGRFDRKQVELVGNFPLADTLGFRVAARVGDSDGYIQNNTTGKKYGGVKRATLRGKLKWNPNDSFEAIAKLDYGRVRSQGIVNSERLSAPYCSACAIPGVLPASKPYETNEDYITPDINRSYDAQLRMKLELGQLSVLSITNYRDLATRNSADLDTTSAPLVTYTLDPSYGRTFTQDFQIASNYGGAFDFLAGATYQRDKGGYTATFGGVAFAGLNSNLGQYPRFGNFILTKSEAAYAEVYVRPSEHITLTAGGRYSRESRRLNATFNASAALALTGGRTAFEQKAKFDDFTPRLVAAYDAGWANFYASYSQGFKAGGFNVPAFSPGPSGVVVRPEKIRSYEVGSKMTLMDQRIQLNMAAFHYNYKDLQVQVTDSSTGTGLQSIQNAASAAGDGVEAEVTAAISPASTFYIGGSYLHARFKKYSNASQICAVASGLVQCIADLSGNRLPRAPKWQFYSGVNYEFGLPGDYVGRLNGLARYSGGYDFFAGGGGSLRFDRQKEYTMVNVMASIQPPNKSYELSVFVENLLDEVTYAQRITTAGTGSYDMANPPRTYGARLTINW